MHGSAPQGSRTSFLGNSHHTSGWLCEFSSVCVARQEDVFQVADPLLISTVDVSRAHFNVDAVRNVYVPLPEEDSVSKEPGICGKIAKDDVRNFGRCSTVETALCTGLRRRGISHKAWHPRSIAQDLAHGDDCFIVGRQKGREHALDLLQAVYVLSKVVTLRPGPSHSQAVTFLGRTQTLRKRGIEYEPDKQHVPRSLKALGLTGARCGAIQGTDDVGRQQQ